ncbi:AraC family transcriptional regulator [Herbiconiux sp. UC225_62]|uniref:AraC family transcriptional regulator n=1 Tax=Herbiconiux sp. UC225_62 TaxID=3350168 RepID=UPI0036D3739E
MGLEFEHRSSESPWIERVWRSRSLGTTTMTSVARSQWDFVFWEGPDGIFAGVKGPESRASQAPVPADADFLGIRLALGVVIPDLPGRALVDRFVDLPTDGSSFHVAGNRLRTPRFDDAEVFIEHLIRAELLLSADIQDRSVTERTRQRRYLAAVGLPQRTVLQIERASDAAVRLKEGQQPALVAQESGYFDQPHLARSLRRFIGPTATELGQEAENAHPLSLLYKTSDSHHR